MTTYSYSGDNWDNVVSCAIRGRHEYKFTNCERLQLRLRDKRLDLQRLEDMAGQIEGDVQDAERAIRQNVFDALVGAAATLTALGSLLFALRRFRSVINSVKRLLDRQRIDKEDLARILAELGTLFSAVSVITNVLRAIESSRKLDAIKSKTESLARDTQQVRSSIESIASDIDQECFSPMRNVG